MLPCCMLYCRVELFKQRYQKLHEIVIQTYSNEKLLLDKVRAMAWHVGTCTRAGGGM